MTIANLTRTFGVELEVNTRRRGYTIADAINAQFSARGIDARCIDQTRNGYNSAVHNDISDWKIVPDPTVSGWEVVSPPMTLDAGKLQVEAVTTALQGLDCWVSRETGLHVHHDVADLTGQQVGRAFATYATFQELFNKMVAPSRRGGYAYSKPISWERITENGTDDFSGEIRRADSDGYSDDIERKIRTRVAGRSVTMNIEAVHRHGTIEFRQHQGSLNAEKIMNWVMVTQSIIESAVQGTGRNLKPTLVVRAEGKPNAFRKRGEFARFRESVKISSADNGVPMGWRDAFAEGTGPDYSGLRSHCEDYYGAAFAYFAKVVKKFAANPNAIQRAH